ncbi:APC family permease [Streptomyces albidoflavus]|uniref:APC family permease n=1 Tax=Streptomyces albidoflavus TaxID=1886 RepID=UPI0034085E18
MPLSLVKRLLLGRPLRSGQARSALLSKRLALPVFASDPLSSVAYATQEMLLVLSVGGLSLLYLTPWRACAVMLLLTVVVISYRQVVRAYPGGGGSYQVVSTNLGPSTGLAVGAALLVDYVLTVAVSVASGVANIVSAAPALHPYRIELAVMLVSILMLVNLRGVRESGRAFAAPTYLFVAGIVLMCVTGLIQWALGHAPEAQSAHYSITPSESGTELAGVALVMLVLRAFSSGCTALTGVEAISNGVPAFQEPKSRNAATTLAAMALLAVSMFAGITVLSMIARVHVAADPCDLVGFPDCRTAPQLTVIAQLAAAVFGSGGPGFFYIQTVTALVLILAANTAFNGFPPLASLLARRGYLPRQFSVRGDRLVFSNGVILLATAASALLWIFDVSVSALIHLYILGVFTSFTLSQAGMVRHWNGKLAQERDPASRKKQHAARAVNAFGAAVTGCVLTVVLLTKFTQGAWLTVLASTLLWTAMRTIHRHYSSVSREFAVDGQAGLTSLRLTHAVVPVASLDAPTLRSLSYAAALRPDRVQAVTVAVDHAAAHRLNEQWERSALAVRLQTLASPYREITRPLVGYVRSLHSPHGVVAVLLPQFVTAHWWEHMLHNRSALWLQISLAFAPGVMVVTVPWHLTSVPHQPSRRVAYAPGAARRGYNAID